MMPLPPPPSLPEYPALAEAGQLILVTVPDWTSSSGSLQRFERKTPGAVWQGVGQPIPVSLGKSGLAWGIGLHPRTAAQPSKREGDGRAPAGIFAISTLFGRAAADSAFALTARLPYQPITSDLKAIDDPASRYYNRIVDQTTITDPDWTSCEDMQRTDDCYAVGAVIAHNSPMTTASAGSCIFLHVWKGPGQPTEGCTAGSFAEINELCAWLDQAAKPKLVQLPVAEYHRYQTAWSLP